MYYSYDCYLNNKYITHKIVYAEDTQQAIQSAYYANNCKYDIRNVRLITGTLKDLNK